MPDMANRSIGTPWVVAALTTVTVLQGRQSVPRVAPASVGLDAAALGEATSLLRRFVDERKIAGAVALVARHGKIAYLESVGGQDLTTRAPMSERSVFRIYSMTKAVTAVAVMQLYEQGRFRLDDAVSTYLPEFAGVRVGSGPEARPPARPITVEDLLLHMSGLSHRTSDLYRALEVRSRADTLPQFVVKIARAPLMEDPGTRFRYSEATTVLGRLVEVWSGQPFESYLGDRVLGPLRMQDTRFWVTPDARARLATAYTATAAGGLEPVEIETIPFTQRPSLIEGAVGLVSTAPDFFRFSQMLLNRGELEGARILGAETVARMTGNGLPAAVLAARGGTMGWGLANVNVVMTRGSHEGAGPVGEYGWDGTAGTIFWVDPSRQLVTILMTQVVPANPDGLRQRFKALVERAVIGG
jgi:CubicO group peptidase (beta-lactamase class C family)